MRSWTSLEQAGGGCWSLSGFDKGSRGVVHSRTSFVKVLDNGCIEGFLGLDKGSVPAHKDSTWGF